MRNSGIPLHWQLSASGKRNPTATPGNSADPVTFNLQALPGNVEDMFSMGLGLAVRVRGNLTSEAGFPNFRWEWLHQIVEAFRVRSEILGELFPIQHTRGSVLSHLIQVWGLNYRYPHLNRAPFTIPLESTQAPFAVTYWLPFALEGMRKPHHHAIWAPFLEGGELEVRIAAANALQAPITAATNTPCDVLIDGPVTLSARLDYLPSPEAIIPRPWQSREYITPGGSTQHILRNVGGQSGLRGVRTGARIVGLVNLSGRPTDPGTFDQDGGTGLNGATDGAGNIVRIDLPWRGQVSYDLPDAAFENLRAVVRHPAAEGPNGPTAWPHFTGGPGAGGFPIFAGADGNFLNHGYNVGLPLVSPGVDEELTKLQRVNGDLVCNYNYTVTPLNSSRHVSLEVLDYTDDMKESLMRLMGKDPKNHALVKKTLNKQSTHDSDGNPLINTGKLDSLPDKIIRVGE